MQGGEITVADIAFAALASPVLLPAEASVSAVHASRGALLTAPGC